LIGLIEIFIRVKRNRAKEEESKIKEIVKKEENE
jgi:hypothetical protein